MITDTIAAIATAMTNSGIGIIRISGSESISIIRQIFEPGKKGKRIEEAETYTAHYGYIKDKDALIDECVVLIMKGPHSYTREDVVEIDCHGGIRVMQRVLETVLKYGARPAEPGEFTKRAFLNGRIDLSQAEAVMDVIRSKNDFALESSLKQLNGVLLRKIQGLRKQLIHQLAFIESALDDPEHYSVDGYGSELKPIICSCIEEVNQLLETSENGKILKEGIKTAIVGKPNAGKSSLLNLLVGEERAIVTEIAGTTRDTLEESILVHGIPLNIIDTAGIRDTDDIVEKIGVGKAKTALEQADLILYVVDASGYLDQNDTSILHMIQDKKVIALLNKSDLDTVIGAADLQNHGIQTVVEISAKEETGLDDLYEKLKDLFFEGTLSFNDEIYITNIRHKQALLHAKESLNQVIISIEDGLPEDFYSIDLISSYEELGTIIGESMGEDLVNEIFAEFCMGK